MEQLEDRTVLTGNVIATVAGGYLRLFGDGGNNQIEVQRVGASGVAITSLDSTTTINGQASLTFNSGVSQGLIASLGNGDDVLQLSGNATERFRVNGNTSINTGNGDDTVRFINYVTLGSLAVSTGAGRDQVLTEFDPEAPQIDFGSLRVWGATSINTGPENDIVSINNGTFAQNFILDTSYGNDTVDVRNSTFGRLAFFFGGSGTDSINNVGNTFAYSPYAFQFESQTSIAGPNALNDTVTVAEGGSATINVLGNDVANSGTLDVSTVLITQQPARGSATVNADGTISYTNAGGEFATDSFRYTVRNSEGDVSNEATVNIVITPVNDLPVATADSFTVAENATATLNLATNDVDAEGRLRLNSIAIVSPPTSGSITINANGTVSYTQNGAEVTSDSFTYTIADLDGGVSAPVTVNLTITPVNDAPTLGAIANVTTNEDTATGAIAINIGDAETAAAALTVTATSNNQTLAPNANLVVSGSGSTRTLVITPAPNASGTATITVNVNDGTTTTTQTFTLTVTPVNDAPTISAVADVTTTEDVATAPISVTVGDWETPNALTVTAVSSNTSVVANNGISVTGSGATRTVVVTPVAGASGSSDITLTVSDGTLTTTEQFTVTVTAVNDAPTISTVSDIGVAAGATIDPISITVNDEETAAGSLTVTATSDNQALIQNGSILVSGTTGVRTVTITPVVGATGTANITLSVSDGVNTTTETLAVNINAAPTITAIADQTINEDGATGALSFTINDAETAAGSLTLQVASSDTSVVPLTGIVLDGTAGARTVTVTPVANASGSSNITITVTDATGISATESFLITVNPVNDLPTLSTVANVNVQEDATIAPITLTIGDVETSLDGLTLSATSDNQAVISNSGLVLSGSGATRTLTIAQVPNASGTANITLTLTDADGGTATRTFAVIIAAVNDAPIAANLSANVLEGGIATVNLGAAATDAEGQVNVGSIVITQQPARGDVTINTTTGVVTYSHDDSETTSDSFSYTIKDAQGLVSAEATVNLTVQPVNDAPVVADETLSINSDVTTAITINVLTNDTDPDGPNTLTVSSVIGGTVGQSFLGTYGMITLNANGTLSFTLDPDAVDGLFSGSQVEELIAYEVSDGLTSSFGVLEIDIDII